MTSTDTLLPCEHCGCRFGYHEAGCAALIDDIVSVAVTGFKDDVARILSGNASTPPTPATEEREAVDAAFHKSWCAVIDLLDRDYITPAKLREAVAPFVAAEILAAEANERARHIGCVDGADCDALLKQVASDATLAERKAVVDWLLHALSGGAKMSNAIASSIVLGAHLGINEHGAGK